MSQDFKHSYKDSFLEFSIEAKNDEHSWGDVQELIKAILKVVKCTDDWKQFELYVVIKENNRYKRKT